MKDGFLAEEYLFTDRNQMMGLGAPFLETAFQIYVAYKRETDYKPSAPSFLFRSTASRVKPLRCMSSTSRDKDVLHTFSGARIGHTGDL